MLYVGDLGKVKEIVVFSELETCLSLIVGREN